MRENQIAESGQPGARGQNIMSGGGAGTLGSLPTPDKKRWDMLSFGFTTGQTQSNPIPLNGEWQFSGLAQGIIPATATNDQGTIQTSTGLNDSYFWGYTWLFPSRPFRLMFSLARFVYDTNTHTAEAWIGATDAGESDFIGFHFSKTGVADVNWFALINRSGAPTFQVDTGVVATILDVLVGGAGYYQAHYATPRFFEVVSDGILSVTFSIDGQVVAAALGSALPAAPLGSITRLTGHDGGGTFIWGTYFLYMEENSII